MDRAYRALDEVAQSIDPVVHFVLPDRPPNAAQSALPSPPPPGPPRRSATATIDQAPPPPQQVGAQESTFTNAIGSLGGSVTDLPATDHDSIQCGIFGPAHAEATCNAAVSHAECRCDPNVGLWGKAVCGCASGPPAGRPGLASADKQCTLEPQDWYCPSAGVSHARDPAFPRSSNCVEGYHGWCQQAMCSGNTFTLGMVGCTPDRR
jgi:hypothetical protein